MNALQVMNAHSDRISAIAETILTNKAAQAEASAASGERAKSLAGELRGYVRETAEGDVSVADGFAGLVAGLTALGVPKGTVKASGNHYKGYRKLLSEGVNIDEVSTAGAQEAIASDDVKAVKAAKAALATHAKEAKWGGADWLNLLDILDIARPEGYAADADDDEAEEVTRSVANA